MYFAKDVYNILVFPLKIKTSVENPYNAGFKEVAAILFVYVAAA